MSGRHLRLVPPTPRRQPRRLKALAGVLAVTVAFGALAWFAYASGLTLQPALPWDAAALAAPALVDPESALARGGPWLNSPPPRPQDLRGKVVLVNFWSSTSIGGQAASPTPTSTFSSNSTPSSG